MAATPRTSRALCPPTENSLRAQREIYDIVLGAQNAALAALKPGADDVRRRPATCSRSSSTISIRTATISQGQHARALLHSRREPLPGSRRARSGRPRRGRSSPAWSITVEPGLYIPEEKIGVRIEDDVLVTADGYRLLTARLPRSADEIEKIMASAVLLRHPLRHPLRKTFHRRTRIDRVSSPRETSRMGGLIPLGDISRRTRRFPIVTTLIIAANVMSVSAGADGWRRVRGPVVGDSRSISPATAGSPF